MEGGVPIEQYRAWLGEQHRLQGVQAAGGGPFGSLLSIQPPSFCPPQFSELLGPALLSAFSDWLSQAWPVSNCGKHV